MNKQPVIIDERTVAVVDTSLRFAYTILSFGVLIVTAVRGFFFHQECWDLMGLVVISSSVATIYQRVKHIPVLPRGTGIRPVLIAAVIAIAIAVAIRLALKQ